LQIALLKSKFILLEAPDPIVKNSAEFTGTERLKESNDMIKVIFFRVRYILINIL
jgi:hypothetical protein